MADIQPEDLQVAANEEISRLLNEKIALRATLEATERVLAQTEQELSQLREKYPEDEAEPSPNGKAEVEVAS